jgi:dihydrolipoamide dehydrogenase
MKTYDIAVVGTGSGLAVVEAALSAGLSCAVVEREKFGGTCLTKGCIPSKMLVYPADLIREAGDAGRIGLSFERPEIDWARISDRLWRQIGHTKAIEESLEKAEGLAVYKGTAEFTAPYVMRVTGADGASEEFRAERIVLAAGARSFVPPVEGLEEAGYLTSETFFGEKYPKAPWKSLVIVGGGAIGAEFAHIFSALGTKVTVVEMKEHIVPTEEEEVSAFVERNFQKNGIDVIAGAKVVRAAAGPAGKTVSIEIAKIGERRTISCEEIFVSSGVRSNADLLNLPAAGIRTDKRGYIETDEYLQTSLPNVYAIGDINGKYQFRHKANYEAAILTGNLFGGIMKKARYDAVPWAIFTWPQVGHVGITEREAKEKGIRYGVARNRYSSIAGGISMGITQRSADDGFAKIILDRDMKILGAHVVGPYASVLVQPFVYLMNAGMPCPDARRAGGFRPDDCPKMGTVDPMTDSMVIHPSMNELTAWAIEDVEWQG